MSNASPSKDPTLNATVVDELPEPGTRGRQSPWPARAQKAREAKGKFVRFGPYRGGPTKARMAEAFAAEEGGVSAYEFASRRLNGPNAPETGPGFYVFVRYKGGAKGRAKGRNG